MVTPNEVRHDPSRLAALFLVAASPILAASATARPLVLEEFFRGEAVATGRFANALDGSQRGITVRFHGRWDRRSATLTLAEDIAYSDGEKDRKVWHLVRTAPGTYVGRRTDIVGTARGFTDGQGRVHLRYRAIVGNRTLTFDDVLALAPGGGVVNTASVSFLFVHVGDVRLDIRRIGR